MKNGRAVVNFSYQFSWILKFSKGAEKVNEYFTKALRAYLYDRPDIFYLDPRKIYINTLSTHKGVFKRTKTYMTSSGDEKYYVDGYKSRLQISNIERKIKRIVGKLKKMTKNMSDYEKIKFVHDYLIGNIKYDNKYANPHMYSIHGALIDGICVCAGYARALKYILEANTNKVEPTKVMDRGGYKEIWWNDLGVKFKNTQQQTLIDGYISMVERNYWDEYDKKREIKQWQVKPYNLTHLSASLKQFGNQTPIMSISIHGDRGSDDSFRAAILYIKLPNDKKELTETELLDLANTVINKLSKPAKAIKFMASHWNIPNEYTDYNEIMKL
jgi:hypothetical protein